MKASLRALLVPGLLLVRLVVRVGLILMGMVLLFVGLINHYVL
jgi:hypothetical protein